MDDLKLGNESYESGDYSLAVDYYRKAADAGNAEAMFKLGNIYLEGKGVEPSGDTAVEFFIKARDKGHVESMCALGRYYYWNKNYDLAYKYYKECEQKGGLEDDDKSKYEDAKEKKTFIDDDEKITPPGDEEGGPEKKVLLIAAGVLVLALLCYFLYQKIGNTDSDPSVVTDNPTPEPPETDTSDTTVIPNPPITNTDTIQQQPSNEVVYCHNEKNEDVVRKYVKMLDDDVNNRHASLWSEIFELTLESGEKKVCHMEDTIVEVKNQKGKYTNSNNLPYDRYIPYVRNEMRGKPDGKIEIQDIKSRGHNIVETQILYKNLGIGNDVIRQCFVVASGKILYILDASDTETITKVDKNVDELLNNNK